MKRARKRVLVTGGAGFLGSHLCDRLVQRGDDVLCVDNFYTGARDNIAHLVGNPRFEVVRQDIVHPFFIECEQIYNLACPASPVAYQYNPIKTIKTSTVGMVNVLGLAKRCRARILQALSNNRALVLHNHGLLTVGKNAREAFVLMKYLMSAAEIQLRMEATGGALIEIPPAICEKVAAQYQMHDAGRGAADWPAYLRMLDRIDPSYRD
jgi:hypothetical protein